MTRFFRFQLADGTEVTKSFNVVPVNYPVVSRPNILTGDPLTFTAPTSVSLATNVYRVELNNRAANEWYISLSGSNSITASTCIISGSYFGTGSLASVTFDMEDCGFNVETSSLITIAPVYKNVGYNAAFILGDTLNYTTDANGSVTVPLVPSQSYDVTFYGAKRVTAFTITVPTGSCYASDIISTDANVAKVITPANQAAYAYTAQASDARYLLAGTLMPSASYALTASVALNASTGTAASASWASQSLSASYASTASFLPRNTSYAITCSWATQSLSSSYINTLSQPTLLFSSSMLIDIRDASGSNAVGGNLVIQAASVTGSISSTAGSLFLNAGSNELSGAAGVAGTVNITAGSLGYGVGGSGGNVTLAAGKGMSLGGDVIIAGGGVWFGGAVGNVLFPTGSVMIGAGTPASGNKLEVKGNISCSALTASNISATLSGTASYALTASVILNAGAWSSVSSSWASSSLSASVLQNDFAAIDTQGRASASLLVLSPRTGFDEPLTVIHPGTQQVVASINYSGGVQASSLSSPFIFGGNANQMMIGQDGQYYVLANFPTPTIDAQGNLTASLHGNADSATSASMASSSLSASYALSINRIITGSVTITDDTNVATLTIAGSGNTGGSATSFTSTPAGMVITAGPTRTVYFGNTIEIGGNNIQASNGGQFLGTASYALTASVALNAVGGSQVSCSWASSSLTASVLASNVTSYTTLATSSLNWVTCSFNDRYEYVTLATSASYAFTCSNPVGAGQVAETEVYIANTATFTSSLVWPANWTFFGNKPTALTASRNAVLNLKCYGGNVVAAWSQQF